MNPPEIQELIKKKMLKLGAGAGEFKVLSSRPKQPEQ
jgi:hypothetical protein